VMRKKQREAEEMLIYPFHSSAGLHEQADLNFWYGEALLRGGHDLLELCFPFRRGERDTRSAEILGTLDRAMPHSGGGFRKARTTSPCTVSIIILVISSLRGDMESSASCLEKILRVYDGRKEEEKAVRGFYILCLLTKHYIPSPRRRFFWHRAALPYTPATYHIPW
jgi:hypothetical protein